MKSVTGAAQLASAWPPPAPADLVGRAEQAQRLDSGYVRELALWTPAPASMRCDGVSPSSYPARPERTSPHFPGRDFAGGRGWGWPTPGSVSPATYAGVACVLTTAADSPADWVNAGYALLRLGTVIQNSVSLRRPLSSVMVQPRGPGQRRPT